MWSQPEQILYDHPYVYCVFQYGLAVYEVGDSIVLQSQTYLEGNSQRMVKSGNLVFIACGAGGLQILDVQDPASPHFVSSFNPSGYVSDIVVRDTVAYIAASTGGIYTADISDVSMPEVIGHIPPSSPTAGVTLVGVSPDGKTILSNWGSFGELSKLAVIDATHLDSLDLMDTIQIQEKPRYFAFRGDTAFIAAWIGSYSRILSLDVSSPSNPVILDNDLIGDQLSGLSLFNSRAIIPFLGQLDFYDFSDPTNLRLVKTLPVPGAFKVDQSEDRLVVYASAPTKEVQYYDITGNTFQQKAKLSVEYGAVQNGLIAGDYALVQCKHLQVLRLIEDLPPSIVDSFEFSGSSLLATGDNLALVTSGYGSYRVLLDLKELGNIKILDSFYVPFVQKAIISNNLIYFGENYLLTMYDVNDPTHVNLVGQIATSGIRDLEIDNHRAYITNGHMVTAIDVSDPSRPTLVDSFPVSTSDIEVTSNILFCKVDSTILAYDMIELSNAVFRGSYMVDGNIWGDIVAHGMVVAFQSQKFIEQTNSDAVTTVKLVDFSDMSAAELMGEFIIPETGNIDFDGRWLLLTSTRGSLLLSYQCCEGSTGNMDCDHSGVVDISDVTSLIDFLFVSLTPLCCPAQGDLDQSGNTDIADLTQLIESLFITIVPLPNCSN